MYKTVTDDFIITTIGTYKEESILIEGKILAISRFLSDEEDLIAAASFPAKDPEAAYSAKDPFHDLDDVYRKYLSLAKNQREDCAAYVQQLYEKKDAMERVMASFRILPEKERRVLEVFCEKNTRYGRSRAVLETEHALYLSERSVQRIRKRALEMIRVLYESNRTLLDLQMEAVDVWIRQKHEDNAAYA